MFDLRNGGATY
jgi:hypothetical protein